MAKAIQRIGAEKEELACDLILEGKRIEVVVRECGFQSVRSFQKYLIAHPEFAQAFERAQQAECILIEQEYRDILKKFGDKEALVQERILKQILVWRNRQKYGDKTQIDMNVSIDIAGALDRASRRVVEATATNVIALPLKNADE